MSCNICGNNSVRYILRIERPAGKMWDIYECIKCLTQFILPIPSSEELEGIYHRFYGDEGEGLKDLMNPNYGVLSFPRQWGIIKSLANKKEGKILDFGCGGGHFLDRVSDNWGKSGVELSEVARSVASRKGIKAVATLEEGNFSNEYFDVIVMFATIEHLPNPRDVVSQLSKLLKVGGLFAIATGDVGSVKAKLQGEHWHLYEPPGHIYFFTARSVDFLMESLGYKKVKYLYTDGGETKLPTYPLNMALRVGIEIFQRMPIFRSMPLFDCYYGYFKKVESV